VTLVPRKSTLWTLKSPEHDLVLAGIWCKREFRECLPTILGG
jgi:hypothetical protein